MWATIDGPRLRDFGITEEDLDRAPRPFVARHRPAVLVAVYLVVAVLVIVVILRLGGSWPAAVFLTVMALAAASILLLPLVVVAMCAAERAEERWLCRRLPWLRACLAYRRAVDEHALRVQKQRIFENPNWWISAGEDAYRAAVESRLPWRYSGEVLPVDLDAVGVDFVIENESKVIVRCVAGNAAIPASIGREMAAILADGGSSEAVIVCCGNPSPNLVDYIADRPISIVHPWELEGTLSSFPTT